MTVRFWHCKVLQLMKHQQKIFVDVTIGKDKKAKSLLFSNCEFSHWLIQRKKQKFKFDLKTHLPHARLTWSKILITGPHLSGFDLSGHNVTVGNVTFFIGWTNVFDLIGISSHAGEKMNGFSLQHLVIYFRIQSQFSSHLFVTYLLLFWSGFIVIDGTECCGF